MKLHQLSSSWSDVKKASYVKHAVREYKIHRQLRSATKLCLPQCLIACRVCEHVVSQVSVL